MSKKPDGGPAFPAEHVTVEKHDDGSAKSQAPGMSLRDWFAGMALISIGEWELADINRAQTAYRFADAMLAEREK